MKKGSNDPVGESYIWALTNRTAQIRHVLTILANDSYYPIIIHCYGGKDRTGILSALIHLIAGTARVLIIQDYFASGGKSSVENMECLLDFI